MEADRQEESLVRVGPDQANGDWNSQPSWPIILDWTLTMPLYFSPSLLLLYMICSYVAYL